MIQKSFFLLLFATQLFCKTSLAEQFEQTGYVEICNSKQGSFDVLYACFDELIDFFQSHPAWAQKLYLAKERFIRSKDRQYYSTDFFGLYDESKRKERGQVAFYYSTHFHDFLRSYYPELTGIVQISRFLDICLEIQKPCAKFFNETAAELGLSTLFSSQYGLPPILFKVVKYLPSYVAVRPHYDGSVFSVFLDSTDAQSLLLSPYRSSFTVADFSVPLRACSNSVLLIPGTLLTPFSVSPTPHIVLQSGKVRYAAIAFAMRPNCPSQTAKYAPLPNFKD